MKKTRKETNVFTVPGTFHYVFNVIALYWGPTEKGNSVYKAVNFLQY